MGRPSERSRGGAPWTLPGIGMDRMRYAVTALQRGLPAPRCCATTPPGFTVTVSSVPDGMANGLLAGVNPTTGPAHGRPGGR